ncbi:hypothetical protein [Kamptonema sp. UHCC 0994]|uniref:hypothetical protein n=1 Tax=Kamptonema sp. UHCC 0994 TaxID=3031329 RepID=UPI0023B9F49F|nr:hypothetical protein [Kamptonema sp. UHCC 0994]MDF0552300.1 hypothetical protein [Kamptonema sp. UHCC 0994]
MSPLKLLPTSIRHLAAQFRPLTQPTVWIPTVVFCLGGVFLWEVSVHPEWLSIDEENTADSIPIDQNTTLSPEDSRIAADIDTVPVLINQLNRSSASAGLPNNQVIHTQGLFDEIRNRRLKTSQPESTSKPSLADRYFALPNSEITTIPASANNNRLNVNSAPGGAFTTDSSSPAPATSLSATNFPNSGKPSPNPLPISPLQAAMEKYRNTNFPTQKTVQTSDVANSSNSPLKPNTNPALTANQAQFSNPPTTTQQLFPGLNPSIPSANLNSQPITSTQPNNPTQINPLTNPYQINQPNNFYPNNQTNNLYQTNLSGSAPIPEVQPITPSAPSPTITRVESTVPNNFGQSSFPSAIQGSKIIDSNSTNSGNIGLPSVSYPSSSGPNFGVTPNQVNQTLSPIGPASESVSLPRPMQGRYIGGGEINTFANP